MFRLLPCHSSPCTKCHTVWPTPQCLEIQPMHMLERVSVTGREVLHFFSLERRDRPITLRLVCHANLHSQVMTTCVVMLRLRATLQPMQAGYSLPQGVSSLAFSFISIFVLKPETSYPESRYQINVSLLASCPSLRAHVNPGPPISPTVAPSQYLLTMLFVRLLACQCVNGHYGPLCLSTCRRLVRRNTARFHPMASDGPTTRPALTAGHCSLRRYVAASSPVQ